MPALIITAAVVVLIVILLCMGYVKAPPDMAFIISGINKGAEKCIYHGDMDKIDF